MRKIGLTIGKYAPLHKGHQYVIETALKEMDELIIFLYDCPECINVPIETRENWIKTLYPNNTRVIKIYDGPKILGKTQDIMKLHADCIVENLRKNNIQNITAFYSSEFYGEYMAKVLNCINRQVDSKREKYKITASKIKDDINANKEFLASIVYEDMKKYFF